MSSNAVFKKSLLAASIAMSIAAYSTSSMAACDPQAPEGAICETISKNTAGDKVELSSDVYVTNGNGVEFIGQPSTKYGVFKSLGHDVTVTGNGASAIYLGDQAQLDFDIMVNGGSSIISENGTAIVIEGGFDDNDKEGGGTRGVMIKDGSLVKGKEIAIDYSTADTNVRIDVNGTVEGNIIGNNMAGNKINFAYGGDKTATFNGYLITGAGPIQNHGHLSVVGKDRTVVWETDYTNNSDTTMSFVIGDDALANGHTILDIEGTADFKSGSTIAMTYTGANIDNIVGQEITVLEADEIKGTDIDYALESVEENLSPLLTGDSWLEETTGLTGETTGTEIIVKVDVTQDVEGSTEAYCALLEEGGASEQEMAAGEYIVSTALTQYNQAAGAGEEEAATYNVTATNPMGELVALLSSSGNDAQLTAALNDELTPDAEGGEVRSALSMVQQMERGLDVRTNYLRNQSYLRNSHDGWNGWTQVIYSDAQMKDAAETNGYDLSMMGASFGLDRVFDDNKLFGLSTAMAYSDVEIAGGNNTKDVQSYQFMTYAGWFNDRFFVDGSFNMGFHNNSSTRYVGASTGYEGNQKAEADYASHQMGYRITAGTKLDFNKVMIQPQVSYGYQWIRVEDYEESGSPAALRFDRQSYVVNEFGIGAVASQSFRTEHGTLTPSLTMMAYRDLSNDEVIQESAGLVNDADDGRFLMTGESVGDNSFYTRLGADMEMVSGMNVGGGLTYYTRGDYQDIALTANANWRF
ncbi:autotransporter outer membrane beta-barrel domain-containing protein [Endozoicomonas sp.]|uniref:autotransporter family protein n=1 Tax=Endozoicomonas sp. TaxID=1892382 RepID=UPI003AF8D286